MYAEVKYSSIYAPTWQ